MTTARSQRRAAQVPKCGGRRQPASPPPAWDRRSAREGALVRWHAGAPAERWAQVLALHRSSAARPGRGSGANGSKANRPAAALARAPPRRAATPPPASDLRREGGGRRPLDLIPVGVSPSGRCEQIARRPRDQPVGGRAERPSPAERSTPRSWAARGGGCSAQSPSMRLALETPRWPGKRGRRASRAHVSRRAPPARGRRPRLRTGASVISFSEALRVNRNRSPRLPHGAGEREPTASCLYLDWSD